MVELHWFPVRVNGQILPSAIAAHPLRHFRVLVGALAHRRRRAEDSQRRQLGLSSATASSTRRIMERGSLEIQAYDEFFFPGLAAEWTQWSGQRPFVGALTMEMPTDADDDILSWCAAGTPPIYFGFGSMPVKSFGATVEMISAACAAVGRAGADLYRCQPHRRHVGYRSRQDRRCDELCDDFSCLPGRRSPRRRGHHGRRLARRYADTDSVGDRDQPVWAAAVKRLEVGSARRLSATTLESLVGDLRRILAPRYVARAREIGDPNDRTWRKPHCHCRSARNDRVPRADHLMGTVVVVALAMATDPMRLGVTLLLISRPQTHSESVCVLARRDVRGCLVRCHGADGAARLRADATAESQPAGGKPGGPARSGRRRPALAASGRAGFLGHAGTPTVGISRAGAAGVVPVPVGVNDDPSSLLLQPIAPTGMSLWMGRARSMFKGESLWVALAAGLGQGPAPPEYLVALVAILASRANIGAQIGLAVLFNLIMLGVCELTLISYLAMPTKTEAIVGRLHGWVGAHRRRLISLIVGVVAVCLIVTGSS